MYEKSALSLCGMFRVVRGLDSVFCAAESLREGI